MDDNILNECGCINPTAVLSKYAHIPHDTKYCAYVGDDLSATFQRMACARRRSIIDAWTCVKPCSASCLQVNQDFTHSFAKWPTTRQKLPFYERFIANTSLAATFHEYERILLLSDEHIDNATTLEAVMDFVANEKLIESNFLQIVITSVQPTVIKMSDVEQMTFVSFMCQLGGVLNLYAGITMVVLVEVIELLIRIIKPEKCKSAADNNTVKPVG